MVAAGDAQLSSTADTSIEAVPKAVDATFDNSMFDPESGSNRAADSAKIRAHGRAICG